MVVVVVFSLAGAGLYLIRLSGKRPVAQVANDCTTTSCLEYKQKFREAMDDDENPCNNFYKYVCGTWLDIQDSGVTVLGKVWSNFTSQVASTFGSINAPKEEQASLQKAAVYIQACLGTLQKSNVPGMKIILEDAGIVWPRRNPKPDFLNAIFFMALRVNMPVLFGLTFRLNGASAYGIYLSQWKGFHMRMRGLSTLFKMGRLPDHIQVTYESFGGTDRNGRLRELTEQFMNMTEFFEKYAMISQNATTYKNVSAFFQLTPTIQKERWDSVFKRYVGITISGAHSVNVNNVAYFAAVFELQKRYGEAVMNDIVEGLCIQNLVGFTEPRILESFYQTTERARYAAEGVCFAVSYTNFGYAINFVFLRSKTVPYQEVKQFAENISKDMRLLLIGNSSLVEGSKQRSNFEGVFHVLKLSQPGSYPRIYEQYPDMTQDPLKNLMLVTRYMSKSNLVDTDTFLRYSNEDTKFKGFQLMMPYLFSPMYSSGAHWGIRYGGIGARIAAAVFCDYVEGSAKAHEVYQKNQDCLSNKTGEEIEVNLQAAVASVDIVSRLYENERMKTTANDPLFMNILPLQSEQIPFVFGCYLLCGQNGGEKLCNVPLRHSANFARAFKCPEGSPMNPTKKCWMLPT